MKHAYKDLHETRQWRIRWYTPRVFGGSLRVWWFSYDRTMWGTYLMICGLEVYRTRTLRSSNG